MNEISEKTVPYITFESMQARSERTQNRLIIAMVICIACLCGSNLAWLWAFMQHFI